MSPVSDEYGVTAHNMKSKEEAKSSEVGKSEGLPGRGGLLEDLKTCKPPKPGPRSPVVPLLVYMLRMVEVFCVLVNQAQCVSVNRCQISYLQSM